MLSFFAVLMSWRLTGVWLHEWLGIGLLALILVHLVVHWGWVEARVAVLARSPNRRFGALLLNTAVFAAMGATIVSGFVVSKVVVPNGLTPESYLHWHGLHESAATFTVIALGLHLAFNWDRLIGAARRVFRPRVAGVQGTVALPPSVVARRLAWILSASLVLTAAVWSAVRLTPHNDKVMFIHADGSRELAPPPPEITKLRLDTIRPAPTLGAPRFAMSLMLLIVVGLVGRRLLTVRRRNRPTAPRRGRTSTLAPPVPNDSH